jgi:predicted O-methyltransferase YrrM
MSYFDRAEKTHMSKQQTIKEALEFLDEKWKYVIIEFGTSTDIEGSTPLFAEFAMQKCGKLYSIEIQEEEIDAAVKVVEKLYGKAWHYFVEYLYPDYFEANDDYDFVFIDSYNRADLCMCHFKSVEQKLNVGCVLLIDDIFKPGVKGQEIVPYLENHPDWEFLFAYRRDRSRSYNGMMALKKVK